MHFYLRRVNARMHVRRYFPFVRIDLVGVVLFQWDGYERVAFSRKRLAILGDDLERHLDIDILMLLRKHLCIYENKIVRMELVALKALGRRHLTGHHVTHLK